MARILHFADLHLDRSFAGLGMASSEASKRREELRAALRRIVDLALELNVAVLTVGGDLYEHDRITLDTGQFVKQQFERLGQRPVLIAPGNHDPYVPDAVYRRIEWPANVRIFDSMHWQRAEIADSVTVWGVGHTGPAIRDNLLRELRVGPDETAVALLHGSDLTAVPEGKATHSPFERRDVEECGAAFVLLGHYHNLRLWPDESPRLGYPGSPEPLDFGEAGPHFVLLLDVTKNGVSVQPLQINEVSYRQEQIDIAGMTTSDLVREAIVALARSEEQSPDIVRVDLVGQAEVELQIDVQALLSGTAERFRYLDIFDKTLLAFDIDSLREETTTRGAYVRKIEERIAAATRDEERQSLENALRYGLQAFAGQEVRRR